MIPSLIYSLLKYAITPECLEESKPFKIFIALIARNEATEESDIDIAIIMRKDMEEIEKEQFLRWSAEMDIQYDRVFSIVDIQEEQLEKWGEVLPFYKNVREEGVVLWKAA